MKKHLPKIIASLIVLALSILSLIFSDKTLSDNQKSTLLILCIVCGASVLYCFVIGEITRNNSQMDKLWSILPIAYAWLVAIKGNFNFRLIIYAVIVTIWGVRLTINFARKGAYKLKFWEGEEDYRWAILRKKKPLSNKLIWALFNLFFISFYQNALVLAITLPSLACMESATSFGLFDCLAIAFALLFLILETIADEQQWKFHQEKKRLLKEHGELSLLPYPYNLGFNTIGLWGRFRHPNYLGEQGTWVSLYIFAIAAGVARYGIFHWSFIGPLFLVLLFMGSSTLGEAISSKKYPRYKDYQKQVFKYLPIRKFNPDK